MSAALRRVHPGVPGIVALAGASAIALGYRPVGAGLIVGALLAFVNALFLYQRVELAAQMGDVGRALLVMQMGLLFTFTVVGAVTIVLIKIALPMAVASAAGFGVTHLGLLTTYYLTRSREPELERNTT